jgi:hypothetical protein
MNERIRELLPNPFAVDYQYQEEPLDLYTEKEMIKFAKLIIQECAGIVKHNVMNISTYADAEFVEDQIKEYFGVE